MNFKWEWYESERLVYIVDKLSSRTRRERVLIAIMLNVAIVAILFWTFLYPIWEYEKNAMKDRERAANVEKMRARNQELVDLITINPNQRLKQDIRALERENVDIENMIYTETDGLVLPEDMLDVLSVVLKQVDGIRLVSFENLPKEEIKMDDTGLSNIYKHRLKLTIKTTYTALVDYLKRIDRLPLKIYWQFIDYEMIEYPNGELNIEVFTFSTKKEVLRA